MIATYIKKYLLQLIRPKFYMKNPLLKILLLFVFIVLTEVAFTQGYTRIHLIEIKIINSGDPKVDLIESLASEGQLILDYKKSKRLKITYMIDSLNQGESIKYKIEGFDVDWIRENDFNQFVITNLDPGRYNIKVGIFKNNESIEENIFHLLILPPFWKTFWFNLLQILLIAGVILYLYFNNVRLKRKLETSNI